MNDYDNNTVTLISETPVYGVLNQNNTIDNTSVGYNPTDPDPMFTAV